MLPTLLSVRIPTKLAILWRGHFASRGAIASAQRDGLSFLVIRLDGLGDVVLTTPLFRELKRAFPGSSCTVVVREAWRPLLATNPHIDEVIGLRPLRSAWLPSRLRDSLAVLALYWGQLRGRRFDITISPRWDVDDCFATLLCSLVDARDRVGYTEAASPAKQRCNRGFDAAFNRCLASGPVQHEVLRNLEIVKALGGRVEDSRLEVKLSHRDREFAQRLFANVPTSNILVAIGIGGRSPARRWPLENYAGSLARLGRERPVQGVIVCSHDEQEEARKLAKLLPREAIIVSGAPLRKVCAVLERCDLFVGNDSGSAHLAAAMDCRVIVISRHPQGGDANHANSPVRFAPFCEHACVLQPAAGLDGCTTECLSSSPHCIKAVTVDEVLAAMRAMLQRKASAAILAQTGRSQADIPSAEVEAVAAVAFKNVVNASKVENRFASLS